jgi:NADP-reducing hydrogenase subunit HndB
MPKLTPEELDKLRQRARQAMSLREGTGKARIVVHMGTCGIAAGAREILGALLDEISRQQVEDVVVTSSGCAGLCSHEPMVTVERAGEAPVKYVHLTPEKIRKIFADHVLKGRIVAEYALAVGSERQH